MKNNREKVVIADIAVLYDSLHKTPKYSNDGYPMVRVTDINRGYLDLSNTKKVDENTYKEFTKKYKPQVGDILFSRVGSYGNSSYVNNHEKFCLGQNTVCISPNHHLIDSFYLYCCLNSFSVKQQIDAFVGGVAQPTISLKNINLLEIPYPNLPTQKKIAGILSAYDELIENNTRRIEILEEMARSIYREWFVKFRFPGHEQGQMVDSELGLIPEGWEVKPLSEVCQRINYGYTAKAQAEPIGLKLLRITDIVPHLISWDSVPYCEISDTDALKFRLEDGDIVIARTGATVGYAKRLNKRHPESVFASYLVRIRINEKSNSHYIGVIVESDTYKDFIKANMSGAAQPQANAKVLTSFPVILPPKKFQDDFKKIVSVFFDHREILQVKNDNLRQTRDLLLPRLISGEIDVENLDINTGEIAA